MGNKWQRTTKPGKTYNNDNYWICPVCNGGGHYFGFDNPDGKDRCPECGSKMKGYRW